MKKIIISLLLGTIVFVIQAQERHRDFSNMPAEGIITGQVIDNKTQKPVEYASIAIYSMRDSSIVNGTVANENGEFRIEKVPYGGYYAVIKFIGYERKKVNKILITPRSSSNSLGQIGIEQTAVKLDEVEIAAERKYMEYKIDRKVVNVTKDVVAAGGTAVDVLENTPSIETDLDGNVSLRGSGNFQLLIDGKPSVIDGNEMLKQLPAEAIEQIEIITNPSAKFDPDGIGGIINVIMKTSHQGGVSGIISASYGSFNNYSSNMLLNYRNGKFNFFVGGNFNRRGHPGNMLMNRESNFGDTTYFMDINAENERAHGGYSAKAGFDYELSPKTTFSLSGVYGQRSFEFNMKSKYHEYADPLTYDEYYYRENLSDNADNYYSSTAYLIHKFDGLDHYITGSIFYSGSSGNDHETTDEYLTDNAWNVLALAPNNQRSTQNDSKYDLRVKTDYTRVFKDKGKLEAGLQFRVNEGSGDFIYELYDTNAASWVENKQLYNNTDFKRNIYSGYSTFSSSFFGIEYMLGLRGEYTDRNIISNIMNEEYPIQRFDLFPSLHFSYKMPLDQQVQLSYSRRIHRPREWYLDPYPDIMDPQNIRIGNPGLEPEYINSFELNYQKRFKKSFVSIEGYYREKVNKIERVRELDSNNVMYHTFANLNKDYATGVELMANFDIKKWWNLNVSGSAYNYHIDGEILDAAVNQTTNTWNMRASNTFKLKWGTRIQLDGMYRAPSVTAQGNREAMYFVNFGIRQEFLKKKLSASFQIRDIFQTMNFEFYSYGANFSTYNKWERYSPTYNITLSYKINNYRQNRRMNGDEMEDYGGEEVF